MRSGTPHTRTTLSVGSRLGSYDLRARLGEGGMGEVWKAYDPKLQRTVAINVLNDQEADAASRILAEARAASGQNHPNRLDAAPEEPAESIAGRLCRFLKLGLRGDRSAQPACVPGAPGRSSMRHVPGMPTICGAMTVLLAATLSARPQSTQVDELAGKSAVELERGIENAHPATYYVLARRLFEQGDRDEAVFWFYAGQLRYRFHLSASRGLDPTGDPALFASFSEVIGRPLNEYAFGSLDTLQATIGRVLDWDERTPNGFTSKMEHETEWREVRTGLEDLRTYLSENGETIRRERTARGLPNRP